MLWKQSHLEKDKNNNSGGIVVSVGYVGNTEISGNP